MGITVDDLRRVSIAINRTVEVFGGARKAAAPREVTAVESELNARCDELEALVIEQAEVIAELRALLEPDTTAALSEQIIPPIFGGHEDTMTPNEQAELDREQAELDRCFSYHAPAALADRAKYEALTTKCTELATLLFEVCPPGSDRGEALRLLQWARLCANASLASLGQPRPAMKDAAAMTDEKWVGKRVIWRHPDGDSTGVVVRVERRGERLCCFVLDDAGHEWFAVTELLEVVR